LDKNANVKSKLQDVKKFVKNEIWEKNLKPSQVKEKIKNRFEFEPDYQFCANLTYGVQNEIFGEASKDAYNLKVFSERLRKKFPEFFYKDKAIDKTLKSLFFSTPGMQNLYENYNNLLILDSTFGTNRFSMPFVVGCIVNNEGRTLIAFFALLSQETAEEYEWCLEAFLECFKNKQPDNIITDECPSIKKAVQKKFSESNHYLCAWHKSSNIKKQLSYHGISQKIKSNLFRLLIKLNLLGLKDLNKRKDCEQLLIDLYQLPYCLSRDVVDKVFQSAFHNELLKDLKYLKDLEEAKTDWSAAYRKGSFTLRAKTSQRVERMNHTIKRVLSPSMTLNEMLVRMLSLHNQLTNHDFEENEFEKTANVEVVLSDSKVLARVDGIVSNYAFKHSLLNLAKCLS